MAFREVAVAEIREVLRAWLSGAGLRQVAAQAGVDRKTARRYVQAAVGAGLAREAGAGQLSDELVGQVAEVVRPVRPGGHGLAWEQLEACRAQVEAWVKAGLSVVKIGVLLVEIACLADLPLVCQGILDAIVKKALPRIGGLQSHQVTGYVSAGWTAASRVRSGPAEKEPACGHSDRPKGRTSLAELAERYHL
jgi:hypothetical protein